MKKRTCSCQKRLRVSYVRSDDGGLRRPKTGEEPEFYFVDDFHAGRYEEGESPYHDFLAFGQLRQGAHTYRKPKEVSCSDAPSALAAAGSSSPESSSSASIEDPGLCIRCRDLEAVEPFGYCVTCFIDTKLEVATGLRRLRGYLDNWAAFGDWERARSHAH
jgi:hypothetical protein